MNRQFTIGFSIALVLGLVGGSLLTQYAKDALPLSTGGGGGGRGAMRRADLRATSITQPASRGNSVAPDDTPFRGGRGNGLGAGRGNGLGAGRGCSGGGGGCSETVGVSGPASGYGGSCSGGGCGQATGWTRGGGAGRGCSGGGGGCSETVGVSGPASGHGSSCSGGGCGQATGWTRGGGAGRGCSGGGGGCSETAGVTETRIIRSESAATDSGPTCSGDCAHAQGEDTGAEVDASTEWSRPKGRSWGSWIPLVGEDESVDVSTSESADTVAAAEQSPWSTEADPDSDAAEFDSP